MTDAAQPGAIHDRWIVFITTDDRSGALTALAETFSSRGVSFESFNTLRVGEGEGEMSIIFRASARLARVITRTLERIAVTRAVRLVRAADPDVRAVAVVTGADPLITGSLVAVETALEQRRGAGEALEALTVLPPA